MTHTRYLREAEVGGGSAPMGGLLVAVQGDVEIERRRAIEGARERERERGWRSEYVRKGERSRREKVNANALQIEGEGARDTILQRHTPLSILLSRVHNLL